MFRCRMGEQLPKSVAERGHTMKRMYVMAVVALGALMVTGSAIAAPPTFDPTTDFAPSIDSYANTLFDGIVALLPPLLACAAVFTVLGIAVRAIRKWLGQKKANAVA